MKHTRRFLAYSVSLIIGIILLVLGCMEVVDSFWSGMGGGLMAVGILRLVRTWRYQQDGAYRERMEIEATDERNQFIRNKDWAWAGFLFLITMAVAVIVLKIVGQDLLSIAASGTVCLMTVLYWFSYLILRRKY